MIRVTQVFPVVKAQAEEAERPAIIKRQPCTTVVTTIVVANYRVGATCSYLLFEKMRQEWPVHMDLVINKLIIHDSARRKGLEDHSAAIGQILSIQCSMKVSNPPKDDSPKG